MIHKLTSEFELIQNDYLREFAVEAVRLYEEDADLATHIKKVINYLTELLEVIDGDDTTKDLVTVAGLLHRVGDNTMDARIKLTPFLPIINRDSFQNILYLIERQDGFASPYPEYQPQIDSPVHVWLLPMAIRLAKGE